MKAHFIPGMLIAAIVLSACGGKSRVTEPEGQQLEYFHSFEAALRHPETARMVGIVRDPWDTSRTAVIIPDSVGRLRNLESIYIHGYRVGPVPRSIVRCMKLHGISFIDAQLDSIPAALFCLRYSLFGLSLSYNNIASIPANIDSLQGLFNLWLDHNRIVSIPDEIGNMKYMRRLELNSNRLIAVPAAISGLKDLRVLRLDSNMITTLPAELGTLNIDTLILSGNPISEQERQRIRAFMPVKTNIYF
jgi:hypothetical protein